jgi:hypothetical protein
MISEFCDKQIAATIKQTHGLLLVRGLYNEVDIFSPHSLRPALCVEGSVPKSSKAVNLS